MHAALWRDIVVLTLSKSRLTGLLEAHYGGNRWTKDVSIEDTAAEAIACEL